MKQFMLIFIGEEYEDLGFTPEEIEKRMGNWFAWDEKMKKDGVVLLSGDALQPQVRRIKGKDKTVTDFASADLKEVIGGYYVVEANSLEDAQKIALDFPDYDLGSYVEIREVLKFE